MINTYVWQANNWPETDGRTIHLISAGESEDEARKKILDAYDKVPFTAFGPIPPCTCGECDRDEVVKERRELLIDSLQQKPTKAEAQMISPVRLAKVSFV